MPAARAALRVCRPLVRAAEAVEVGVEAEPERPCVAARRFANTVSSAAITIPCVSLITSGPSFSWCSLLSGKPAAGELERILQHSMTLVQDQRYQETA